MCLVLDLSGYLYASQKATIMANILVKGLITGLWALFHPFYISVIEINHNQKEANVEISIRVFAEDLEAILQKYNTAKIDIDNPPNKAFLDGQIATYLKQKIKLKVNGQAVTPQYIGHEIQKESAWCFFEVPKVTDMSKLEVDCNLLYDFETNQTNILHVKSKGVEKSEKLEYPKRTAVFSF
jgi:hypothetical protein